MDTAYFAEEKNTHVTRGFGLLERFLAEQRSKKANSLIPPACRQGRILDIGCGQHPLFLMNTKFQEKYGLEKHLTEETKGRYRKEGIALIEHNLEAVKTLPFEDGYFDVITMLAVFEHIDPHRLVGLLQEIRRILKSNGIYVMTTPAAWTDGLLKMMAHARLVSLVEIEDHKETYTLSKIVSRLQEAGFAEEKIQSGYVQIFMNFWLAARK